MTESPSSASPSLRTLIEEIKAALAAKPAPSRCPSCGHCPSCGRTNTPVTYTCWKCKATILTGTYHFCHNPGLTGQPYWAGTANPPITINTIPTSAPSQTSFGTLRVEP